MNTKQIAKELKAMDFDKDARKEILNRMFEDNDFEVANYRFIHGDIIDTILVNEMLADEYVLGCFTSWAISDATGWPIALIDAAQKGEAFQEIGEAMTKDQVEKLAEILVSNDGYGHHFAVYDGHEHEIGDYYAFRVN